LAGFDYLVSVFGFGASYCFAGFDYYFLVYAFGCYVLGAPPDGFAPSVSRSKSGFPTSRVCPYPTWNLTTLPA
jgi:hypothetical protein